MAEKGSGDIVSIEWCQHATIFMACELLQINTADQDDVLAIVKSREMYMAQLKRQSWRSRLALLQSKSWNRLLLMVPDA